MSKEDGPALGQLMEIFMFQNPNRKDIQVVMTDKDLTEGSVFKQKMPQITLQICLFQVLTFCREITTNKLNIPECERQGILQIIEKNCILPQRREIQQS